MIFNKWIKGICIILIVGIIGLLITLPGAYTFSQKTNYLDEEMEKNPTNMGYYYYNSTHYADIVNSTCFDENGIVINDYGGAIGKQYNPVTISQYVLFLVPYAYSNVEANKSLFLNLDFLLSYAEHTKNGNLLYPYYFNWEPNNEIAPWYSSMAQGQAASALLWGYKLSDNPKYLDGAKKSIFALMENNSSIPFFKQKNGGMWAKEYPHYKYEVLDGSLATIAGEYDLYKTLNVSDPDRYIIQKQLNDSINCFKNSSYEFKSPFFGHYYDNKMTIPNPNYYYSNLAWLDYLSNYDNELIKIRTSYKMDDCGTIKKIAIFYWNRINAIYNIFTI